MNRILLILTVLLFTGLASAQTPHFYISGAAQWSEPTGDFGKHSISKTHGGAEAGLSGEVDIGLISDYGSTYIGYRYTELDLEVGDSYGTWLLNRYIAGIRWHMMGTLQSSIVPILGAGITIGESQLESYAVPGPPESTNITSEINVGWFVEGGVRVHLVNKLSLVGSLQYHQFDANFEDAVFDENDPLEFDIEYITTSAGLQIYF